jgi:hypothetical protein
LYGYHLKFDSNLTPIDLETGSNAFAWADWICSIPIARSRSRIIHVDLDVLLTNPRLAQKKASSVDASREAASCWPEIPIVAVERNIHMPGGRCDRNNFPVTGKPLGVILGTRGTNTLVIS